jgi:adenylate cyclase
VSRHLGRILLGLAVLAVFLGHAGRFYELGIVTRLDHLLYDTRLRLTAPGGVDDRIVILDIDERSLATPELGRWPWGRDVMAALLAKLFDRHGAALVAFDVVNGEPDRSSGLPVLERLAAGELKDAREFQEALERLRPRLDHDGLFAAAMKGRPVVLGFYFTSPEAEASGALPAPVLDASLFRGRPIAFARYQG